MKITTALRSSLVLAGSLILASLLHAADTDGTWTKDATGTLNWSDTANWSGGTVADGIGFSAYLSNIITADRTITLDTARTIGNIYAQDTTNNYTISGASTLTLDASSGQSILDVVSGRTLTVGTALTVNDGIVKTGAGAVSITGAMSLGAAQTWTNNSAGAFTKTNASLINNNGYDLTIDGSGVFNFGTINSATAVLTGSGALVKNGTGRLNIGGINSGFTGSVTINGGVLQMHNDAAGLGNGNLTLSGGVLSIYWGATYTRTLGTGTGAVQILGGESGFAGAGTTGPTINLGSSVTWGSAYFNPGKFVLGDAGTTNAGATTFSSGIVLNGGARTIVVPKGLSAGGNNTTISGAITNGTGTSNLIKEGGGNLTVSANSSWTGNLTHSEGYLIFSNTSTNWGGTTTVNGGLLDMGGLNLANIGGGSGRNITVAAGAAIRFNVLSNAILNRIVETTDEFTVMTGSTSNNLDFSSSTGANLPNAFLGHRAGNGAKADYSGTITPASDNYRLGSLIFRNGLLGLTNSSPMTGTQGLIVAGRVALVGAKTFSGDTTIRTDAKLGLAAIASGGGVALSLQNSVLDVGSTGGNFWLESNNFSGNPINDAVKTTSAVFGGLKGSRNLRDVYTTTTDVNNGAVTPFMEVSGFTLNPGTAVSANYTGNIANFARDMTLTKAGAGTQTLGGNNSYSGATTINNGVLAIGHANALGRGGSAGTSSGGTIVNSGGTLDLNGVSGVVEPIVLNGTGFGGNGALVNNSGTAASINAGIASLQITSGGTYGTSAPTVSISGTGSGASATVQFGLSAASLTSVTGGVNWAVGDRFTTTGGAGTEAVFEVTAVASGNPTAWTVISGGSGFTGAPTGITRLTKNPTGFAAGTFTFNSTNFAVAGLTLTNGGSGYDSASTATFSSGAATATVQHSSVVLASDSSIGGSGDISIGAVVSETGGSRALTKVGLGTLTLSAVNTYTGATTISGGALSISGAGSINSSTSVNLNGGTLRYDSSTNLSSTFNFTSGTISGTNWNGSLSSLTIGADRTISPGNSPGTATTGDQTWAGGGSYLWEINDATGTAGGDPGWDLLSGTGTLTITATDLSPFTILVTSLTLANLAGEAVNFADLTNYAWLVADFANPISDFSADAFSINTTGFGNTFTGTFGVARGDAVSGGNDTQLFLTYTPVPEPSTALLGGLGLLALLRRRR